ncbi:MAG TPA: ABC transporter permease, partial [Candidatus Eisenbacteria bacterium]|nr:ABC transporter permease [Candidatus Eisenbacteria bacterium]
MTTLTAPVRVPVSISRRYLAAGTFIALGLIDIFVFGLFAHSGDARFALSLPGASPHLPVIHVPGALTAYVLGAISIGLGILRAVVDLPRWGKRLTIAVVLLCFLLSLLAWADAGNSVGPLQVIDLLQGTLTASIPLVLGALAGLLGERSGVINIAIEGQLLTGAFTAAAVASVTGGV